MIVSVHFFLFFLHTGFCGNGWEGARKVRKRLRKRKATAASCPMQGVVVHVREDSDVRTWSDRLKYWI